jgi:hypothetical protein
VTINLLFDVFLYTLLCTFLVLGSEPMSPINDLLEFGFIGRGHASRPLSACWSDCPYQVENVSTVR